MNLPIAPPASGISPEPHTLVETLGFVATEETRPAGEPAEQPANPQFGRYRVKSILGQGGMGAVYLAEDTQLGRDVALKIPRKNKHEDWTAPRRFLREARAVANLQHPNICPLYDVGEQDGVLFMAMAYIEGRPLSAYVSPENRQSPQQAAGVIYKVALALAEAHSRGIIHRDLKPANIMIDRRGEPIVMDFGLACSHEFDERTKLTQDGSIVGTPAYMAPEQFSQLGTSGAGSDIYSLAVVMYELLTGKCPFSGSVVTIIGQVLHTMPMPLARERADVPEELSDICRRGMEKNPADRFASMEAFAQALLGFLRGSPPEMLRGEEAKGQRGEGNLPHSGSLLMTTDFVRPPSSVTNSGATELPTKVGGGLKLVKGNWPVIAAAVFGISGGIIWALCGGADQKQVAQRPAIVSKADENKELPPGDITKIPKAENLPKAEPLPKSQPMPKVDASSSAIKAAASANAAMKQPQMTQIQTPPQRTPVQQVTQAATQVAQALRDEEIEIGPGGMRGVVPRDLRGADTLFRKADRNGDNKLSGGEIFLHIILRVDTNSDDLATRDEFLNAFRKNGVSLFDPPSGDFAPRNAQQPMQPPPPPPPRHGPPMGGPR